MRAPDERFAASIQIGETLARIREQEPLQEVLIQLAENLRLVVSLQRLAWLEDGEVRLCWPERCRLQEEALQQILRDETPWKPIPAADLRRWGMPFTEGLRYRVAEGRGLIFLFEEGNLPEDFARNLALFGFWWKLRNLYQAEASPCFRWKGDRERIFGLLEETFPSERLREAIRRCCEKGEGGFEVHDEGHYFVGQLQKTGGACLLTLRQLPALPKLDFRELEEGDCSILVYDAGGQLLYASPVARSQIPELRVSELPAHARQVWKPASAERILQENRGILLTGTGQKVHAYEKGFVFYKMPLLLGSAPAGVLVLGVEWTRGRATRRRVYRKHLLLGRLFRETTPILWEATAPPFRVDYLEAYGEESALLPVIRQNLREALLPKDHFPEAPEQLPPGTYAVRYPLLLPDGEIGWLNNVFVVERDGEIARFVGLLLDETRIREREFLQLGELRARRLLVRLMEEVLRAEHAEEMFRVFTAFVRDFVPYEELIFMEWDAAAGLLRTRFLDAPPHMYEEDRDLRLRPGQGILGDVFLRGEPEIVPHSERDPRSYFPRGRPPVEHLMAFPVRMEGRVVGVIGLARRTGNPFTEREAWIAEIAFRVFALAYERWRQRTTLHELRQYFEVLFTQGRDGFFVSTPDGRFLMVNRALAEMLGYGSPEDLLQLDIARDLYVDPADREAFKETISREGGVKDYPLRLRRRDGGVVYVLETSVPVRDASGEIRAYVGVVHDITQRRALEEQLRREKERYEAFVRNAREGIWCFAGPPGGLDTRLPVDEQIQQMVQHGYLEECNDAYARMYGYESAEQIRGTRLKDILPLDDPRNREVLRKFIQNGYRIENLKTYEIDRFGRRRVILNNFVGILNEDGTKLLRAWGTQLDITEREELEESQAISYSFMESLSYAPDFRRVLEMTYRIWQKHLRAEGLLVILSSPEAREVFCAGNCPPSLVRKRLEEDLPDAFVYPEGGDPPPEVLQEFLQEAPESRIRSVCLWLPVPGFQEPVRLCALVHWKEPPPKTGEWLERIFRGWTRVVQAGALSYYEQRTAVRYQEIIETFTELGIQEFVDGKPRFAVRVQEIFGGEASFDKDLVPSNIEPKDAKQARQRFRDWLAQGCPGSLEREYWIQVKVNDEKERRWVEETITAHRDAEGRRIFRSLYLDRTVAKGVEEQLGVYQQRLAAVLRLLRDFVVLADSAWRIELCSERMLGLFPDILEGKTAPELIRLYVDGRPWTSCWTAGVRELPLPPNTEMETPDGQRIPVEGVFLFLGDPPGTQGCAFFFRDISERKEREYWERQRERAHLLATMAGGLVHDLRNLLQGVVTNLELLKSQIGDHPYLREALGVLFRMRGFTDQLQRLAFPEVERRVPVNLPQVLREAVEFAIRGTEVEVETQIPDDLFWVKGDPTRVYECFFNLARNAVEAMQGRGRLRVRAWNGEHHGQPSVFVTIEDEGPGIPPELQERIFEPFFTTKDEGTGLGLAIVQRVVNDLGGDVRVSSQEGQGATFRVRLPAISPQEERKKPDLHEVFPGRRILIFDDEEPILRAIQTALEEMRVEVHAVHRPEEVLPLLERLIEEKRPPDLVILDIRYRGRPEGAKVAHEIHNRYPDLPLVALSGITDIGEAQEFRHYGFRELLRKPVSLEDLRSLLARYFG